MKRIITFTILVFISFYSFGQNEGFRKVQYAKTEIAVPAGYFAKDEYSLGNDNFSAQWLYLNKEMVEQGVADQISKQFEDQIKFSKATDIQFISNNGVFKGKKYELKNNKKLKYKVIAFGYVDDQPLILNMGFKTDPELSESYDDLIKKFIQLKK
jgi:hypothetical protein